MFWPLLMVALAYALCLLALARSLLNLLLELRARSLLPVAAPPLLFHCLWWPLIALAQLLAPRLHAPWRVRLVQRLYRADLETALEPGVWAALQVLLLAAGVLLALGCATPLLLAAPLLAELPELWLWLRIRARRRQLRNGWAHSLQLLALALGTGCGFRAGLTLLVTQLRPGALQLGWQRVLEDLRAGRSRHEALLRLERRLALTPVSRTVAAMNQAESGSVSLAGVLRVQAGVATSGQRGARMGSVAAPPWLRWLRPAALGVAPGLCLALALPFLH